MPLLIAGIILWTGTHLFPAILPGGRDRLQQKTGENAYRGLRSLLIIAPLVTIEIVLINRRDGKAQNPAVAAIKFDLLPFVVGLAAFAALTLFHATLFGVPAIPG